MIIFCTINTNLSFLPPYWRGFLQCNHTNLINILLKTFIKGTIKLNLMSKRSHGSMNSRARPRKTERYALSDTDPGSSGVINGVNLSDPDLWDTADSKHTKRAKVIGCEEWKERFESTLNFHIGDVLNRIKNNSFTTEELSHIRTLSKDDAFIHMIQLTGREEHVQNVLLQLFAAEAEQCLEYVFEKYYVGVFMPSYKEFMSYDDMNTEEKCYTIALQIMLRLIKDKLYGEFSYFGAKR